MISPTLRQRLEQWKEWLERRVTYFVPSMVHPNHLTSARLAIILLLPVAEHYQISTKTLFWLLLLAGLSDALDGITARQRHQITPLGTALDPIADKLLVLVSVLLLWSRGFIGQMVLFWIFVLEGHLVVIPILSFIYRFFGTNPPQRHFAIRPSIFGKAKMWFYVVGFCMVLLGQAYESGGVVYVGRLIIFAGLMASAMAFIHYVLDWFQDKY